MTDTIVATLKGRLVKRLGHLVLYPGIPTRVPKAWLDTYGGDPDLMFDLTPFLDELRSYTPDGRPAFDWWCPLSAVDGYGRHALDIWRGLRSLGCDASLCNAGNSVHRGFLAPEVFAEYRRGLRSLPAKVGVTMSVPYDETIWTHQSVVKVVVTQFETDRIPERHVEVVNRCDHFITTGSFQLPIWKRCGVTTPVSHLTPGVDTDFFSFIERSSEGPFKVLMLGALTPRKNPLGAIRIFQAASEGDRGWSLTFKTRQAQGFEHVINEARKDSRIRIIEGDSSPQEVRALYHEHHCFLWPSKGEGVGLPPLEAMSTGMELVCADNSGMSDYLGGEWAWPVRTAATEYAGPPNGFSAEYIAAYGDVGNWWVPSEEHAARQLKRCHRAWRAGRGKGRRAAEYARTHHTLEIQARSVLKIIERYL